MRTAKFYLTAMTACTLLANLAIAQNVRQPNSVQKTGFNYYVQDEEQASPSDNSVIPASADGCDNGCESDCGCDEACDSGCDGGCDNGCSCYAFGPAEACTLLSADPCRTWNAGGWVQLGYHTEGTNGNGTGLFNNYPNRLQMQQTYGWVEKAANTGGCGWDWGMRMDYVFGTDGPDTQAFGGPANSWDNTWDHGAAYGSAIPQLYGTVAYNDLSVKMGHFYTIIGYEVVTAPDNFFYSHSRTMVTNEPFTHTGVLAEYTASDNVTVWGGWTQGWDTGFTNNDGSSFLGGVSLQLTDRAALTYAVITGDFGNGPGGSDDDAYMHSIVLNYQISCDLEYVLQHDYHRNNAVMQNLGETYGINQYLLYTINDCWKAGLRGEWLDQDGTEYVGVTAGLNYKPHANITLRPEVRWDDFEVNDSTVFGIDAIFTF